MDGDRGGLSGAIQDRYAPCTGLFRARTGDSVLSGRPPHSSGRPRRLLCGRRTVRLARRGSRAKRSVTIAHRFGNEQRRRSRMEPMAAWSSRQQGHWYAPRSHVGRERRRIRRVFRGPHFRRLSWSRPIPHAEVRVGQVTCEHPGALPRLSVAPSVRPCQFECEHHGKRSAFRRGPKGAGRRR